MILLKNNVIHVYSTYHPCIINVSSMYHQCIIHDFHDFCVSSMYNLNIVLFPVLVLRSSRKAPDLRGDFSSLGLEPQSEGFFKL